MFFVEQNLLHFSNYISYRLIWRLILLLVKMNLLKLRYLDQDFSPKTHNAYPYPARLPHICAFIGISELKYWHDTKKVRSSYIQAYKTALALNGINLPPVYEDANSHIVPLRIIMNVNAEEKLKIDKLFDSNWYWFKKPIVEGRAPLIEFGYRDGSCPTSERLASTIINLPCNQSPKVMRKILK